MRTELTVRWKCGQIENINNFKLYSTEDLKREKNDFKYSYFILENKHNIVALVGIYTTFNIMLYYIKLALIVESINTLTVDEFGARTHRSDAYI